MVLPKKIFSVGIEGKKKVNGASGDQRNEFLCFIPRKILKSGHVLHVGNVIRAAVDGYL